jgi:hypothetical protein
MEKDGFYFGRKIIRIVINATPTNTCNDTILCDDEKTFIHFR